MPSTRFAAESTPVGTPLHQPPVFAHPDVHAACEPDLGAKREGNGWRTLVNYIYGGQGGSGGRGGVYGGSGGAGEGSTVQYDIKAERVVVKTFNAPEATPSDFLRIPLGNIDLRSEIRVDRATGAVWRHCERKQTSVRRMYSARVVGHSEPMTVALYQGNNAEEEWKHEISRHSGFRHPHVLQIYASASSSGIHATVFHDDLVPFRQFLDSFRDSTVLRAYIFWYTNADFNSARSYCNWLPWTIWIRRSTGRLCIEFGTFIMDDGFIAGPTDQSPPESILNPCDSSQESLIIASLGYPEWYSLCESYLCQHGFNSVSVRGEVRLGSIIRWPSGSRFEYAIEIASAAEVQYKWSGWYGAGSEQWRGDDDAVRYISQGDENFH